MQSSLVRGIAIDIPLLQTNPIFDRNDKVLGAIQVLNKVGKDPNFNHADEERLRNLSKVCQIKAPKSQQAYKMSCAK